MDNYLYEKYMHPRICVTSGFYSNAANPVYAGKCTGLFALFKGEGLLGSLCD